MDSLKMVLLAALPCVVAGQTLVTITTTPNPSRFGAPVVMTASLTPSPAGSGVGTPPNGKVTFYDGVTILGTVPAVANGFQSSASLSTILLPAGRRKLKAYYAGDGTHSPAASNVVTQTVNALAVSNFASIQGGPSSLQPGLVADFNADGIPDIAVAGIVYLGDGRGSFRSSFQLDSQTLYNFGTLAAVGDFNGDGKPDLVLLTLNSQLGILLGNGDGTFQQPVSTPGAYPGNPLVVADFNGDGKADLTGGSGVLLGNGDGTFRIGAALGRVDAIVAGDFNGDGLPDLITNDGTSLNLNLLQGNGDGTFRPAIAIPLHSNIFNLSVLTEDFNGDGQQDLAVVTPTNDLSDADKLYLYLGRGDGTFQSPVSYSMPFGAGEYGLSGDYNGDGILDLAFNGYVLAGNGDGTFQPLFSFREGAIRNALSADFNGDGRPDIFQVDGGNVLFGTTTVITASGGTLQSTAIGTQFPAPLQVTVTDNGVPLSGVTVTFSPDAFAPNATATLSSQTAVTNASGVASVIATADDKAGSYTVTAYYQSRVVTFSLTNVAGSPGSITAPGAVPQSTPVGTPFSKPLTVQVKDGGGNVVSGATVTYQAPQTGASAVLSSNTATTDASGVASITATANQAPGSYTVTATAGTASVGFLLTNLATTPSTVTLTSATNPSTFGAPVVLTATVTPSRATGHVTFYDGVAILGTKPLFGGTASLSTILLPAGTRQLRALYSGDLSYAPGASNVVTQRVNASAGGDFRAQALNVNLASGGPPLGRRLQRRRHGGYRVFGRRYFRHHSVAGQRGRQLSAANPNSGSRHPPGGWRFQRRRYSRSFL